MVRLKRAYAAPDVSDGTRILVDRLWPRGVSKEQAAVDAWMKELAPSAALRKWFGHDLEKWNLFEQRYTRELYAQRALLRRIEELAAQGQVTLVYGARDAAHNNAVVLAALIERRMHRRARPARRRRENPG